MKSRIPPRATPQEILTELKLREVPGGDPDKIFKNIKSMAGLLYNGNETKGTRISQLYGPSGKPEAVFPEDIKRLILEHLAANDVKLVDGLTPNDIGEALDRAAERMTRPAVLVRYVAPNARLINDIQQWRRVVFLSPQASPLMQKEIQEAIFRNLIDTSRNLPTVDINIYLGSESQRDGYVKFLKHAIYTDLEAITPVSSAERSTWLFDRADRLFERAGSNGSVVVQVEKLLAEMTDPGNVNLKMKDDDQIALLQQQLPLVFYYGEKSIVASGLGKEIVANNDEVLDVLDLVAPQLSKKAVQNDTLARKEEAVTA